LLLWLALRSNMESDPALAQLWADSFTKKSVELYGAPNPTVATELLGRQIAELGEASGGELSRLIGVEITSEGGNFTDQYESLASEVKDYMLEKYADVYEAMDIEDDAEYSPADIKDKFDRGMAKLTESNPAWLEWKNELVKGNMITAVTGNKRNNIGDKHQAISGSKLKVSFSHEVLMHDLEAVNGATSLPNYSVAMEGKAALVEFALLGELPSYFIDHYANIALAMGMIDGRKRSRPEMIEFIKVKEQARIALGTSTTTTEEVEAFSIKRANRYYRGTPGSDQVGGIFTRDISYFQGFVEIAEYVKAQRAAGKSIAEIMEYLSSGMFDPNNPKHVRYMEVKKQREAKANGVYSREA
jgi:hypothetical protein